MNNRKKITYAALALLACGFAGCSQEEVLAPQDGGQELRVITRGTTNGETTDTFTDDFTLHLCGTTDAAKSESHTMTYTDGEWSTVKSKLLPAHAFAYKGSTVSDISYTDNEWDYTVTLTANQSTEDAFNAADVMIATGEAQVSTALALNFKHYFARVTFNVTIGTEYEGVTLDKLAVKTTDTETSEVTAFIGEATACVLIAPGTYTVGEAFATVTLSDETVLTVKVPDDGLTFAAGTHYTFKLKVGKDKVTITSVTTDGSTWVGGWNNDEETELNG